ncbi:hypothetical protein [Hymenobacter sp. UYAg731]
MMNQVQFRTSYSQFYICDKDSPAATDSDGFWNQEAFDSRLAIEDGILGVGTETYSYVRASIEILAQRNDAIDSTKYDHIVEASIKVNSGVLQILDCPNSTIEFELTIKPGFYRARIYISNLDSITDEDQEGNDFYLIEMWPEEPSPRKVLKQYVWPR